MSQVLDTLYVDIVARGMAEAEKAISGTRKAIQDAAGGMNTVRQQAENATGPVRRMADQIERAGRGVRDVQRGGGGFGNVQAMGTANRMPTAGMIQQPGASAARAAGLGSGGVGAGAGGLAAAAGALTAAVGVVTAALAVLAKGFQGTVELERFSRGIEQVFRELSNLFAPALQLAGDMLLGLVNTFRAMGREGQLLIGAFSPILILGQVLADSDMQSSIRELATAFGELAVAFQPLINLVANTLVYVVKNGIIEPLRMLAAVTTIAVRALTRMQEQAVRGAEALGFGFLMRSSGQARTESRLNQTGTEDAQATFARIQEAVLRAGGPATDEQKQTSYLQEIDITLKAIRDEFRKEVSRAKESVQRATGLPPSTFAAGSVAAGAMKSGGVDMVAGLVQRFLK